MAQAQSEPTTNETSNVPQPSTNAEEKSSTPEKTESEWHPLDRLRDEVDRLFDDFNTNMFQSPFRRIVNDVEPFWRRKVTSFSSPDVDIVEKDECFEVAVELPGIDEKDIDVSLVNGSLKIAGEKKEETKKSDKDYYLNERHFGMFERRFALPDNINSDDTTATFKNGVLKVVLPKKPTATASTKKITVKSA